MRPIVRRRCPLVFVLICLSILSGCRFLPPTEPNLSPLSVSNPQAYTSEFKDNWCYRYLDERLQDCYGAVYTALTERSGTDEIINIKSDNENVTENIGIKVLLPQTLGSKEEAQKVYDAFFHDNPQFFYVSSVYCLEGYMEDNSPQYNQINLLYTMDKEQRKEAVKKMTDVMDTVFLELPDTEDQFEIELYLHDKLASLCSYDTAAAAAGYSVSPHAYTAYGALVKGRAVCEGYSRAMQLLLKKAGMDCTLVTGLSTYNGESHMWNMVTVNGENYHLDVTWDDSEDRLRHNYFNMSTTQTAISHSPDIDQLGIGTCTNTAENYFQRQGLFIDTYDRQAIASVIAKQVLAGEESVEIALAEDTFDNALLFLKNTTLTKQMVNAYLADHGVVLWDYSLRGETNEHILTLYRK